MHLLKRDLAGQETAFGDQLFRKVFLDLGSEKLESAVNYPAQELLGKVAAEPVNRQKLALLPEIQLFAVVHEFNFRMH
ncbi:MAG: hypothetical protein BWX83_01235 [Candidatus Cloacimonetes bacterium ADurb.Bin117]|nr:MAG: hypothetical protein BWX83_01235 [Candidatus Cloacimonetes bacterium ADurb.Bin117]